MKIVKSGYKIRWENPEQGKRKCDILTGNQTMIVEISGEHKTKGGVYLLALYGIEDGEYRGTKLGLSANMESREYNYNQGTEKYEVLRRQFLHKKDRAMFEKMLKAKVGSTEGWRTRPNSTEYISKKVPINSSIGMFEHVYQQFYELYGK